LTNQTLRDVEIIVVDNSTNGETVEFITRQPNVKFKSVTAPLGSQPLLRNEGARMANGTIVAFIDDDGVPEPEWLSQILRCYDDSKVGAVGGRIIQGTIQQNSKHVGRMRLFGGPEGNWDSNGDAPLEVDHLQGTNMSFRMEIIRQLGGWDRTYCGGYATFEELDMCIRVKQAGYRILFNPKAVVLHEEAEREGEVGRSVSTSPLLAYYTGRNATYLYLKNFGFTPRVLTASLVVNPMIESIRCLFGSVRNPHLNVLRLNSLVAPILHCAGVARGFFLGLRRFLTPKDNDLP
jgi:hypothetical protein